MTDWGDVIDLLVYGIRDEDELGDELASRTARQLIEEPLHAVTPEQEYAAIKAATGSGAPLTGMLPTRHSDRDIRAFLRTVLEHMDAARPWPELPFAVQSISRWAEFAAARPVGRIHANSARVQERLRRTLRSVGDDEHELNVLILRLATGELVALAAPWWAGSRDVVILASEGELRDVLDAFRSATGYTADEVTAEPPAG